jgi:hypothetical protein
VKNKYYLLHSHFDLPARENPWLEADDADPSAAPYPTLRERALQTCHGPNAASPLIAANGRIENFLNNYAHLSFSFNPEILDYMEHHHPAAYERILAADRSGGGALACPYPPLELGRLNTSDQRTAIHWGLLDFQRRFSRKAEGLWLAGCAATDETLALAAEAGVAFVVLEPSRAADTRARIVDADWIEAAPETLDTTRPYLWKSGGHSIAVFFYRADLSPSKLYDSLPFALTSERPLAAVHEQAIDIGQRLANRLIDALTANDAVELSHAAAEGSLFGHHRHGGQRALTYALDRLRQEAPAQRTTYAGFLGLFPPPEEVRLAAPPLVEREDWHRPLREALRSLSEDLSAVYRTGAANLVADIHRARELYGEALFSARWASLRGFLDRACDGHPPPAEGRHLMRLLELERARLRMLSRWTYASKDAGDPNALQALKFAARALDLAELTGEGEEQSLLLALEKIPVQSPSVKDASGLYTRLAAPLQLSPERILAHFAIADHLSTGPIAHAELGRPDTTAFAAEIFPACRRTRRTKRRMHALSIARVKLRRRRTGERWEGFVVVHHDGGTDLTCWLKMGRAADVGERSAPIEEAFLAQPAETFTVWMDEHLGQRYGLDALLPSDRATALARLIPRGETQRRAFMLQWHSTLRRFAADPNAADDVATLLTEATTTLGIPANALPGVARFREAVRKAAHAFAFRPGPDTLDRLTVLIDSSGQSELHLDLWELQESAWQGLRRYPNAAAEDLALARWLAQTLGLSTDSIRPEEPEAAA